MTEPFKLSNDKINEIIYYLVASSTKCDMINANALSNLFNRLQTQTVSLSLPSSFPLTIVMRECFSVSVSASTLLLPGPYLIFESSYILCETKE